MADKLSAMLTNTCCINDMGSVHGPVKISHYGGSSLLEYDTVSWGDWIQKFWSPISLNWRHFCFEALGSDHTSCQYIPEEHNPHHITAKTSKPTQYLIMISPHLLL